MSNTKKDLLNVVVQGFYGNRTETEIKLENLDRFILGYIDDDIKITEPINRTIVSIPNTNNIVVIYNKYKEEKKLNSKKELLANKNYDLKPLVVIPEKNIEIYSRCVVCRMNGNGDFESLQNEDYKKIMKYLSE